MNQAYRDSFARQGQRALQIVEGTSWRPVRWIRQKEDDQILVESMHEPYALRWSRRTNSWYSPRPQAAR